MKEGTVANNTFERISNRAIHLKSKGIVERLEIAAYALKLDDKWKYPYVKIRMWCSCNGTGVPEFRKKMGLEDATDTKYATGCKDPENMCPITVIQRAQGLWPKAMEEMDAAGVRLDRNPLIRREIEADLAYMFEKGDKVAKTRARRRALLASQDPVPPPVLQLPAPEIIEAALEPPPPQPLPSRREEDPEWDELVTGPRQTLEPLGLLPEPPAVEAQPIQPAPAPVLPSAPLPKSKIAIMLSTLELHKAWAGAGLTEGQLRDALLAVKKD